MESAALDRDKVEHHRRKRNLCFAALAFAFLVPLPLALVGQVTLAGILCILAAVFVGAQPEFGAEPKATMHDALRAAGTLPLPTVTAEKTVEPKVLARRP